MWDLWKEKKRTFQNESSTAWVVVLRVKEDITQRHHGFGNQ
jgi:hypothetical protein